MPSSFTKLCLAVGVAGVAVFFGKKKFDQTKKGGWKPLSQPDWAPKVTYGRHYFFFTHHKTGTNLMQRICNISALGSSGFTDECAYCFRVVPPDVRGYLRCAPNPIPEHGKLRGTVSRFTLVSSIGAEMWIVLKNTPDFRAVHMIRHPVTMAISAHNYNKYVASEAGKKWRWDSSAKDITNATSTREELIIEAGAIQAPLRDMLVAHQLVKDDPRVMTLDLDRDFAAGSYDETTEKLFKFMFDDPSANVSGLVAAASVHDKSRWDGKRIKEEFTALPGVVLNRTHVQQEWEALEKEGHPDVMQVLDYARQMGYDDHGAAKVENG